MIRRIVVGSLVAIAALLVVGVGGFFFWASSNVLRPMPEAVAALESDERVAVVTEPWLTFRPRGVPLRGGLIFYPGGLVDPRAYAPAARAIAEAGYQVTIVPMPLNLAVLAPDRAREVLAAYPEVSRWAIGGHSLGGAMAARYASGANPGVDGLALWAAFPADDLSSRPLVASSIFGTLDGVAEPDRVLEGALLLPDGTRLVPIEGGNHYQFGWYGPQDGDNPATISREEQTRQAVAATLAVLDALPGTR